MEHVICRVLHYVNVDVLLEICPEVPDLKKSLIDRLIGIIFGSKLNRLCRFRVDVNAKISVPAEVHSIDSHCYSWAGSRALESEEENVLIGVEAVQTACRHSHTHSTAIIGTIHARITSWGDVVVEVGERALINACIGTKHDLIVGGTASAVRAGHGAFRTAGAV